MTSHDGGWPLQSDMLLIQVVSTMILVIMFDKNIAYEMRTYSLTKSTNKTSRRLLNRIGAVWSANYLQYKNTTNENVRQSQSYLKFVTEVTDKKQIKVSVKVDTCYSFTLCRRVCKLPTVGEEESQRTKSNRYSVTLVQFLQISNDLLCILLQVYVYRLLILFSFSFAILALAFLLLHETFLTTCVPQTCVYYATR